MDALHPPRFVAIAYQPKGPVDLLLIRRKREEWRINMKSIKGRIALVTGAGSGIGRAVSIALASEGARLILTGRREEKLLETRKLTGLKEKDCLVVPGDITKKSFVWELAADIENRFGGLDILVNNAGKALNKPFEETSLEEFDEIMSINVRAPYMVIQAVLGLLKKSGSGSIVNIASVTAHKGYIYQSSYVCSKHAIYGLTKSIAKEVAGDGIRVHAICPGGVKTDMIGTARPDLTDASFIAPEDIADTVCFLIKHEDTMIIDEVGMHRIGKEPFL